MAKVEYIDTRAWMVLIGNRLTLSLCAYKPQVDLAHLLNEGKYVCCCTVPWCTGVVKPMVIKVPTENGLEWINSKSLTNIHEALKNSGLKKSLHYKRGASSGIGILVCIIFPRPLCGL